MRSSNFLLGRLSGQPNKTYCLRIKPFVIDFSSQLNVKFQLLMYLYYLLSIFCLISFRGLQVLPPYIDPIPEIIWGFYTCMPSWYKQLLSCLSDRYLFRSLIYLCFCDFFFPLGELPVLMILKTTIWVTENNFYMNQKT